MPWPATHILTAEAAYPLYFHHLDHKSFILGTCFPDIRYPARLEREITHIHQVSLTAMGKETAFRAGLLFHTYVDDHWNAYIRQSSKQLFAIIPHNRPTFHTIKSLQDLYLYDKLAKWDLIASYFNSIDPEELTYGADEGLVQLWHDKLGHYLSKPPVEDDLDMLAMSLPPEMVTEIRSLFPRYLEIPLLKEILLGYYPVFLAHLEGLPKKK
jgi:hypothetical protein